MPRSRALAVAAALAASALLAAAPARAVGVAPSTPAAAPPPNIVFILADDLEADFKQDRLALMPNLRRLRAGGVSFDNHIAAAPLCGPSRGSILSGRLPHNNGYRHNLDSNSLAAWRVIENNTLGAWLTRAGYRTSYLGKQMNGLETTVPSGWHHYMGFNGIPGTYNYYSALQFNVSFDDAGEQPTSPVVSVSRNGTHQADFLGAQTVELMRDAVSRGQPFFIHTAPVMIHYGTCYGPFLDVLKYQTTDPFWEMALEIFGGCPVANASANENCNIQTSPCVSERHAHAADGLVNPHTPSWDVSAAGGVPAPMSLPPSTAYEQSRQDVAFRNRTGSALDLDDMLGVILDGLDALGPAVVANTYVVFTSDNGYHLGEHRLQYGKEKPYTTDVRVPLFIRGPGITANSSALHPTTHVDVTATLVELAGATPVGPPLDGLSFAGALSPDPVPPAAWRGFSFSENADDGTTWVQLRRPLAGPDAAAATTFHWWCSNSSEVFDLAADPWQLANLANTTQRGAAIAADALPLALALAQCAGANCSAPVPLAVIPGDPLKCYKTNRTI
jgi:hypothetical protein